MPTYKILGTDGKEYGPISAEVLRQWIAQKRVTAGTSVQAEGDDWKPLSSYPEFADSLAGSPMAPPLPPPAGPVRTSRLAIASLVCGILGFLLLPALAGLALGLVALIKINKSRGQLAGQGFAIAGLCVSAVMALVSAVILIQAAFLLPALSQAKSKAQRINCVNNLKQVGLAARIYSNDHNDLFPPDFLSMSNELFSPKILVCPGDTQHIKVSTWAEFDPRQHLSYEYLKPGITESKAMNEVIFRCPIHNNVGLGDGSVQQRQKNSSDGRPGRAR